MKRKNRWMSALLAFAMALSLTPAFELPAAAANNGCVEVMIGGGRIGNNGYSATNMIPCFKNGKGVGQAGFHTTVWNPSGGSYGNFRLNDGCKVTYELVTAENEILASLAKAGSGAQYKVDWRLKCDRDYHASKVHQDYDRTHCAVSENGNQVASGSSGCDYDEDSHNGSSNWRSFEGIEKLQIRLYGSKTDCGAGGANAEAEVWLYIRDTKAPTMSYSFETNGRVNGNELLLKLGTKEEDDPDHRYDAANLKSDKDNLYVENYIDMNVVFSEPVGTGTTIDKSNRRAPQSDTLEGEAKALWDKLEAAKAVYEGASEALGGAETALSEAETALNEMKRSSDGIYTKALQAILNGGAVTVTGPEPEDYSFANELAELAKTVPGADAEDPFITRINAAAGIVYTQPEEDAEEDAEETAETPDFSDADIEYLRAAARAVGQAQREAFEAALEAAFDETVEEAKRPAAPSAGGFHADNELATAINAFIASLSSSVQTALKQAVSAAGATAASCAKAMYDARVAEKQSDYEAVRAEYDELNETVTEADAAVEGAQAAFNAEIEKEQAKAELSIPDDWVSLVRHELFNNTLGTGYLRMGMPCYLELYKGQSVYNGGYRSSVISAYNYIPDTAPIGANGVGILERWNKSVSFRYSARRGDFFGNKPVPNGGGITTKSAYSETPLADRLRSVLYDAAGNPVTLLGGTNIFDAKKTGGTNTIVDGSGKVLSTTAGGFDVIVDAEPPTYTRTGNGITPDILTKVVLNENDSLDFIVSFSEATITKRDFDERKTYLLFNNGDRAYYTKKSKDGKQWYFHYQLGDAGNETETTQWLAIALCNDALDGALADLAGAPDTRRNIARHSLNADGRTVTDYVGNVMADRANEDALTNSKQVESSTAWARISIDNTPPELSFSYNRYNSSLTSPTEDSEQDGKADKWGQAGRIYVSAVDPQIETPKYNPDQSEASRPGSGIFRPDNASAAEESASTAKGLFYYIWSPDATPPDAGVNFEVLKRCSLAGWDETALAEMKKSGSPYASWKALYDRGLKLSMANNYSEIVPPEQILQPENSGVWYLHVWTADMSWDTARQLTQYEMMYDMKFASGYRPASALEKKLSMIDARYNAVVADAVEARYIAGHAEDAGYTYDNAWSDIKSDYDYDDAWNDVRADYYSTVYTQDYRTLLEQSGKDIYSDDAELYARNETMKRVGVYGEWPLESFRLRDSNWTQKTAEIRFDNALPEIAADRNEAIGDGTKRVKLPFTVTDAHSGVDPDSVYYQWVKRPDDAGETRPESTKALREIDWIPAGSEEGGGVFAALTQDNVYEDGEYYLSVKAKDLAGNELVYHAEEYVTVNSRVSAVCEFSQTEEKADYYRSVTPAFRVTEAKIAEVRCAVTDSVERPAEAEFSVLTSCGQEDTDFDRSYRLPTLGADKADGTWYVHVLIREEAPDAARISYFYHAYQLDNTAPTLYLSPASGGLERAENRAVISAADDLSGIDADTLVYQWTKSETAPSENASGWLPIASGEAAVKTITRPAENGVYYLHARVRDTAGNSAVRSSGAFLFKADEEERIADYESRLLLIGEENGAYYGIAALTLDTENKAGYRYSLTADGGETWSDWMPYSSMVKARLPIGAARELGSVSGRLAVKFRAPGGTVGEPEPVSVEGVRTDDTLWAVMTPESSLPRRAGSPLALLVEAPEGVTIEVDSRNAQGVSEDEDGDFIVQGNGLYAFILSDGTKTREFVTVVDLYDEVAPVGAVSYSETLPTAFNVRATLETSEPVYVQRIDVLDGSGAVVSSGAGGQTYTFTENGRVRFVFRDEAGNEGVADAEVSNIDREGPDVEIVTQYSDGKGKTYDTATARDGRTISQGMFLTLAKKKGGNQKSFTVVSGEKSGTLEVTENGTYTFIVQDEMGNLSRVSETVTGIAEPLRTPAVSYRFKNAQDGAVPGEVYRNDEVVVTVSVPAPEDGRRIYLGKMSAPDATPLTVVDGCYVLERTYRANGKTGLWFNDGLGASVYAPITVTGIDNTKPTLTLNSEETVLRLKDGEVLSGEALIEALGGYTVYDRETPSENIRVSVCGTDDLPASFDNGKQGVYTVRYYATDGAQNESCTEQTVYVISADDLFVTADGIPLLTSGSNMAILDTNQVRFHVGREELQQMLFRGSRAYNRAMRYDVYYTNGLYREGQMKYIAERVTGEELMSSEYLLTFDKPGWYTIIIRNQERSSIYTSFYISSIQE